MTSSDNVKPCLYDFCRQCGEYVTDDMGHMCPYPIPRDRRILVEIAYRQAERLSALERQSAGVMREMGRKGGKIGGKARLKKITAKRRSEIARKAAAASAKVRSRKDVR